MDSTDVAQLAHGTLHLAGMDHVASRAALTDARQILEDLTQLIDERLFQEVRRRSPLHADLMGYIT